MVRALATRDLQPRGSNVWRVVGKEIVVAAINAAVFALIMGTVASFFFGVPIGLVLGAAMVFNMCNETVRRGGCATRRGHWSQDSSPS